jgi:release factor glutamine methyltransferase
LALDGGKDGLDHIKKIIPQAREHLLPNGVLFLETGSEQISIVRTLFENNNYSGIEVYRDLSGKERVISGVLKPDSQHR